MYIAFGKGLRSLGEQEVEVCKSDGSGRGYIHC
jgi:hypothetical protein